MAGTDAPHSVQWPFLPIPYQVGETLHALCEGLQAVVEVQAVCIWAGLAWCLHVLVRVCLGCWCMQEMSEPFYRGYFSH